MKNKKALFLLFSANAVSGFAQGITMLAIPWYFAQQNMSSEYNFYYAAVTLGSLFWGLYAGALVDGFNRKDVFLGTNFIEGLIVLSISSLGFKEGILPSSLIVMVFGTTFFGYIIHYPNLYAFAQEISDPKDYGRITSYIEIVGQATVILAATFGVILLEGIDTEFYIPFMDYAFTLKIEKWDLHQIFFMDGITYIISFIMIIFIKYDPIKKMSLVDEGDLKDRLKSGYDYLKQNPLVTIFGVCSYSVFVALLVERFSLFPVYIKQHLQLGGDVLSISEAMYGAGALVSGVIIRFLLSKMSIPKSIIMLVMLTSAAFFFCAITQSSMIYFVISLVVGFTNAGSRIFRVSYLFSLVPNELTGRINSMFNVITTLLRMFFIMLFIFPFFSQGSNITYAYHILAVYTFISGLVLILTYNKMLKLTEAAAAGNTLPH